MSIAITADGARTGTGEAAARRRAILALGRIEARRNLWSPWVAVVALYSAWTARNAAGMDWSGATLGNLTLLFVPLSALAFYQGLRAGGRDRQGDLPALAEESPLGEEERVWGRLLGLAAYVAVAVLGVAVIQVASRIEGGYWMGHGLRRTDSAQHQPVEWLQPPLMVAAAATAGLALGRRFRRRVGVGVVAGMFWFLQWGVWWAFQWTPMVVVSFVTTQPMSRAAGPAGSSMADFPEGWFVVPPDEYTDVWMRQVVHLPFVAGHVLYLTGLAVLFTASALRRRGPVGTGERSPLARRLRRLGWATVGVAVVAQLWALDWGVTPGGDGWAQVP